MHLQPKAPFRPSAEVSQSYNDGVVEIYTVSDGAAAGRLPQPMFKALVRLDYEERKVGIQRYYQAKQNQIHVEKVLRVPRPSVEITSQDVAVTENGRAYRIDLVQTVKDVWPASLDLTLTAYKQWPTGNELPATEETTPQPIPLDPSPGGGGEIR